MKPAPHSWNAGKAPETTAINISPRLFVVLVASCICVLIAVVVISVKTRTQPVAKTSISLPKRDRPDAEMKAFWREELSDLYNQIFTGTLPYPTVNERAKELNAAILRRTGKQLAVTLVTTYHKVHRDIECSAGFISSNKTQVIDIHIPCTMDMFEFLKSSKEPMWHEAFQSHVITSVMHELEHTDREEFPQVFDTMEESRAWANTCRYTLVPLRDTYRLTLFQSDAPFYLAWKQAGGDTNSAVWKHMIDSRYCDVIKAAPH